jgi:serine/threonine-protein kinase
MRAIAGQTGTANYGVSDTGTLAYVSGEAGALKTLVWVDRQGREAPLSAEPRRYQYPRLSPDRTRVALTDSGNRDVVVWDLAREVLTNVTASEATDLYSIWTTDGRRLIFSSVRSGLNRLYWQSADGAGTPEPLTEGGEAAVIHYPSAVSPDGARLVYREQTAGGENLRTVSLTGDHATADLLSTQFNERNAEVSPNGRWVAYESNRSGSSNIYVSPFPDAAARQWTISSAGGVMPAWAPNGRALFYVDRTGHLMSVEVDPGQEAFVYKGPQPLLDMRQYDTAAVGRSYAVDQERFLFLKTASSQAGEAAPQRQIHIVLNWLEELKRRAPAK